MGKPKKKDSYKIIIMGSNADGNHTGKSSLLTSFRTGEFQRGYERTIGIDLNVVDLPEKNIQLKCWDAAGDDSFHSLIMSYCAQVDAIIFCIKCNEAERFKKNLPQYLDNVIHKSSQNTQLHLAITFSHEGLDETITDAMIDELKNKVPEIKSCRRVSSYKNIGVNEFFVEVVDSLKNAAVNDKINKEPDYGIDVLKNKIQIRHNYDMQDETQHWAIAKRVIQYVNGLPNNINGLNRLLDLHNSIGIGRGNGPGDDQYLSRLRDRKNNWAKNNERCYRETNDSTIIANAIKSKAWKILEDRKMIVDSQELWDKYNKIFESQSARFVNFGALYWKNRFLYMAKKEFAEEERFDDFLELK